MPSRVIGIDPGFDRCGVAVLQGSKSKQTLLFSTCITTNKKDSHEDRLLTVGDELSKIIKKWKPETLAMEKLFFNQNTTTALKVAEARGVILYQAAQAELRVHEYTPQDVKIAVTGYGRASKGQVEDMALRILGLKKAPKHDDETDAIAVGITCLAST